MPLILATSLHYLFLALKKNHYLSHFAHRLRLLVYEKAEGQSLIHHSNQKAVMNQ
jgi:hypothetical protein